jgi:ferric-dicitrate binding protein FerR (iron transport regulator)
VTLVEGAVTVQGVEPAPVKLVPGDQLSYAGSQATIQKLSPADLEAATAWRHNQLVLDRLTLAQVAERMAAYHGVPIVVAPEIAGLRMGGSCALGDLPGFLEFVGKARSIGVAKRSDGSYFIAPR